MEDTRTADVLLEPIASAKISSASSFSVTKNITNNSTILNIKQTNLKSLCLRSKRIRRKVNNHNSIEARSKRLEDTRREKHLRLLPKIVQRPSFPTFSDSDDEDAFSAPSTPQKMIQYCSSCNICYEKKEWCGFPHIKIKDTVPLSNFELRVRRRARKRMGKSFEWLDEKKDRNKLKKWNLRHVVYKPDAAIKIEKYIRRFLVQMFLHRIRSKFERKAICSHKVLRTAMSNAKLRKMFFATQLQKIIRGHFGRLIAKNLRATYIQKIVRGYLDRARVFRLRTSIARLNGKLKTMLRLQVCSGDNLATADTNGYSDPYCNITVYGKLIGKTKKVEKTLNPTWNSNEFLIETSIPQSVPLNGIGGKWYLKDEPKAGLNTLQMLKKIIENSVTTETEIRHELMAKNMYIPIKSMEGFPVEFAQRANRLKSSKMLKNGESKKKKKMSDNLNMFQKIEFADKLRINLHSANNLKRADGIFGKSDPFVEVYYNGNCIARTKVQKRTLDPIWNETLEVFIPKQKENGESEGEEIKFEMKFVVFDYDFAGANDFLGQVLFGNRKAFEDIIHAEEIVTMPLVERENANDKSISGTLSLNVIRIEPQETTKNTVIVEVDEKETTGDISNIDIDRNTLNSEKVDLTDVKDIYSGKWFYKDPRNLDHVHGPMPLSSFLYHLHSRTVHTEQISELLVSNDNVDFYLPLGQEDRFPQGWCSRAKKKLNENTNAIIFEVKDQDLVSSTSLGTAAISQSNLEILLNEAFIDGYNASFKNQKLCIGQNKGEMLQKVLRLENNKEKVKNTVEARGTITISYSTQYAYV